MNISRTAQKYIHPIVLEELSRIDVLSKFHSPIIDNHKFIVTPNEFGLEIKSFNEKIIDDCGDFAAEISLHRAKNLYKIAHIEHYKNGKESNYNKPQAISFDNYENMSVINYCVNSYYHRLDGPATTSCIYGYLNKNEIIYQTKFWYVNNKFINIKIYPAFENGKQINNIIIDNAMKLNLMMFDREYFSYVMEVTNQ